MSVNISVIVPVYGVEKCIQHTMKALLAQTYRDFEIILVDDETPDCSIEVARTVLEQGDIPYRVVKQKNAGVGKARNLGMEYACGKWIYFLDSDDVISSCTLECMHREAEDNQADLVFCDYCRFSDYKKIAECIGEGKKEVMKGTQLQNAFLRRSIVVLAPGTLYRRSFLHENSLKFESIRWSEDQHFIWRVLRFVEKAVYVKEPLYKYYQRTDSMMGYTAKEKLVDSFSYVLELPKYYEKNPYVARYLIPRWIMGTVNSATVMHTYSEWMTLCRDLDVKKNFKVLLGFDDMKVKAAALVGCLSLRLYYEMIKKRLRK